MQVADLKLRVICPRCRKAVPNLFTVSTGRDKFMQPKLFTWTTRGGTAQTTTLCLACAAQAGDAIAISLMPKTAAETAAEPASIGDCLTCHVPTLWDRRNDTFTCPKCGVIFGGEA